MRSRSSTGWSSASRTPGAGGPLPHPSRTRLAWGPCSRSGRPVAKRISVTKRARFVTEIRLATGLPLREHGPQAKRVRDGWGSGPPAPGVRDAELHPVELLDRMRVRVDHERDARLDRLPHPDVR